MNKAAYSTGLGGDGDEIDAIQMVKERLGLTLNYDDASNWRTVGDLYKSIVSNRADLDNRRTWRRMCVALCYHTGMNPRRLEHETLLIDNTSLWQQMRSLWDQLMKLGRSNA